MIAAGHTLSSTDTPSLSRLSLSDVISAARDASAAVDTEGRFPFETFAAARQTGILGTLAAANPSLIQAAAHCQALAAACGSSGMVLAMHHIQVASLARHARGASWHDQYLERLAEGGILLASSTSEVGIGGDLRTSHCAVIRDGDNFSVTKEASAISYGAESDAILVTARAHADAAPTDQVLAVVTREDSELEPRARWDAMGMRGTSSGAFVLKGRGKVQQIVPAPFHEIAATTMAPLSHILWGAVWTGIAGDAVMRGHAILRTRKGSGNELPAGAVALTHAVEKLQLAEARLKRAIDHFDWERTEVPGFAAVAEDNGLKTSLSETCLEVAQIALEVCGFAGYARQGPYSVSRHLRDLHSAPLMIANSRIREGSARMLIAQRPKLGLKVEAKAELGRDV